MAGMAKKEHLRRGRSNQEKMGLAGLPLNPVAVSRGNTGVSRLATPLT